MDVSTKVMQVGSSSEHLLCEFLDEAERKATCLTRQGSAFLVLDISNVGLEKGQEVWAEDLEYEAGMVETRRPLGRMIEIVD